MADNQPSTKESSSSNHSQSEVHNPPMADNQSSTEESSTSNSPQSEVQNPPMADNQSSTEEPSPFNPPQSEKEYNPKFINPDFYTRIKNFQDEFSSKMNELSKSDSYGKDDDKMKNVYRSLFILMTLVYCRIL